MRALTSMAIGSPAQTTPYTPLNPQPSVPESRSAYSAHRFITKMPIPRKPIDVDPIVLMSSMPYCVSYGDIGRIFIVNVANGVLDLQKMAVGVPLDVYVGPGGTHSVYLYCGPDGVWRGQAGGTTNMKFTTGSIVRICRVDNINYIAIAYVGTATVDSNLPAVRDLTIVTFGQSNSVQIWEESGLAGYQERMVSLGKSRSVWPITGGLGSSSLMRINDAGDDNYWWDTVANAAGPRCAAFITAVTGRPAGQRPPDLLIWDQGEAECLAIAATGPTTYATYLATLSKVFAYCRAQISLPNVPILIVPLGAADNNQNAGGYTAIREAQCKIAATEPHTFIGPEKYDLTRKYRDVHLDFSGRREEGQRLAERIDNILNGATNPIGPRIVAFTQLTTTTFAVDITAGSLFRPGITLNMSGQPIGFALLPSSNPFSTPYIIVGTQWTVTPGGLNRLILTTSVPAAGARLAYPYGSMLEERTSRIVADFTTEYPLETYAGGA